MDKNPNDRLFCTRGNNNSRHLFPYYVQRFQQIKTERTNNAIRKTGIVDVLFPLLTYTNVNVNEFYI